jgi:hypothetical protein
MGWAKKLGTPVLGMVYHAGNVPWYGLSYWPRFRQPAEATKSYFPTPMQRQPDGSANLADSEGTIRTARADLARCDKRRKLAADAGPR